MSLYLKMKMLKIMIRNCKCIISTETSMFNLSIYFVYLKAFFVAEIVLLNNNNNDINSDNNNLLDHESPHKMSLHATNCFISCVRLITSLNTY